MGEAVALEQEEGLIGALAATGSSHRRPYLRVHSLQSIGQQGHSQKKSIADQSYDGCGYEGESFSNVHETACPSSPQEEKDPDSRGIRGSPRSRGRSVSPSLLCERWNDGAFSGRTKALRHIIPRSARHLHQASLPHGTSGRWSQGAHNHPWRTRIFDLNDGSRSTCGSIRALGAPQNNSTTAEDR